MISRVAEAEILFSERGQLYNMTRPICHLTFHLTVDVTQITLFYFIILEGAKTQKTVTRSVLLLLRKCTHVRCYKLLYHIIYTLKTLQRSENFDSKTDNRKKRKVAFGFAYCGDKGQRVYAITIFKPQKSKSVLHN
jgi:hypothetical protein